MKAVQGPLVILEKVKFPKFAEIVTLLLGNGCVRVHVSVRESVQDRFRYRLSPLVSATGVGISLC